MSPVETLPRLKEIHTRFLYPFFFDLGAAKQASEALSQASFVARNGKHIPIWECAEIPALYKEELIEHVAAFLFEESERGCRYLRLSGVAGNSWFNKLHAVLSDAKEPALKRVATDEENDCDVRCPVHLFPPASSEIFLSNYGVGVLSIALTPEMADLDFRSAALFNYKLAQLRHQVAARLRTDHPTDNERIWNQMSPAQKQGAPPIPHPDSPLNERLGCAGGSFVLHELINDVLLGPLSHSGLSPVQNQLSVYTVVRFGEEVDLEKAETRAALAAFLSGISQIEEPMHAGAPTGVVSVTNAILNRRHWTAVGLLGMAHIVSDQPKPEVSFNEQRVPRVLLKYFIPYLAALLQRTSLQRAISDASRLMLSHQQDPTAALSALRRQVLEFALDGYFPEISNREVIHRYYKTAQEGLGVHNAFENARRAISDIDAQFTLNRQVKLAEAMAENVAATRGLQEQMTEHLDVVAKVQMTVEWIEIFIVSVYLAHLWEMFASHIESLHGWISHGVIAGAIVGALGAAAVLKPWRHRKRKSA